jgi:hypothetical protein
MRRNKLSLATGIYSCCGTPRNACFFTWFALAWWPAPPLRAAEATTRNDNCCPRIAPTAPEKTKKSLEIQGLWRAEERLHPKIRGTPSTRFRKPYLAEPVVWHPPVTPLASCSRPLALTCRLKQSRPAVLRHFGRACSGSPFPRLVHPATGPFGRALI